MMFTDLIIIMLTVMLIFESGFWNTMDGIVNSRYRFHHLPHILMCQLCQTWWLCLLYIIVTGNLSLINILLCLVVANMGEIALPLWKLIKNSVKTFIEGLINKIY